MNFWRWWLLVCSLVFSLCEATHGHEVPACRVAIPDASGNGTSYGSGVLVGTSEDASYILTNAHVVADGNGQARLEFPDQTKRGRVIAADKRWDVAIIETDALEVQPIAICDAPIRSGEPTSCGGFGPQGSWRGIDCRVANFFAPSRGDNEFSMFEMVGGEVRKGDSGGPICNSKGELIGVVWGASNGTTFGTPVSKAVALCQQYGVCIGGSCGQQQVQIYNRPLIGGRVIVQQPKQPQLVPVTKPKQPTPTPAPPRVGCECSGEISRLKSELAELTARLESISKAPGPAGKDGRDGKDGKDCDPAAFVQKPFTVEIYSPTGQKLQSKVVQPGGTLKLKLFLTKPAK